MNVPNPFQSSGQDFYGQILDVLEASSIEFLVGGAFALNLHTGIKRDTKDFDLMLRPRDVGRALQVCRHAGFQADYAFSHWIAKVHLGDHFIDLIYRAGNGLCEVDDRWFSAAPEADIFGRCVRLCPVEEMIWQKAYIMERERYDGADVLHLLRSHAATLDWERLAGRFGEDWPVLLSHLILFGYVYPERRGDVPTKLLDAFLSKVQADHASATQADNVCRGTLLSRAQYLPDVELWGLRDARLDPRIAMTPQQISAWTNAIDRLDPSR